MALHAGGSGDDRWLVGPDSTRTGVELQSMTDVRRDATAEQAFTEHEHGDLAPGINRIHAIASAAGTMSPWDWSSAALEVIDWTRAVLRPHAAWEDAWLYPEIAGRAGSPWATKLMTFEHQQILDVARKLEADRALMRQEPGRDETVELQGCLFALEALLRAHIEREQEVLMPLLETPDETTAPGERSPGALGSGDAEGRRNGAELVPARLGEWTYASGAASAEEAHHVHGSQVISMLTVRDAMTRSVVSVHQSAPLKEVAKVLIDHAISGVPVVDLEGAVLGVVSEADLLVKEQGADAIHHRPLARFLGESRESRAQLVKLGAVTAAEAMTSPALTITSDRPIHEAAAVMTARGVNRLPVVDDGRLVGIISRADLVRAYVRSDDELASVIRQDVIRGMLWLDPALFTVIVEDGVASISGRVERRSTAEMIERSVKMVPGVVDVDVSVSWSMDDRMLQPAGTDPVFPFSPQ
jgi:CBS domain-containing protein